MNLNLYIIEFDSDYKFLRYNPLVILQKEYPDKTDLYISLSNKEIINYQIENFAKERNILFDNLIEGDFNNLILQGKVGLLLSNVLYILYDLNNNENLGIKRELIINEILT